MRAIRNGHGPLSRRRGTGAGPGARGPAPSEGGAGAIAPGGQQGVQSGGGMMTAASSLPPKMMASSLLMRLFGTNSIGPSILLGFPKHDTTCKGQCKGLFEMSSWSQQPAAANRFVGFVMLCAEVPMNFQTPSAGYTRTGGSLEHPTLDLAAANCTCFCMLHLWKQELARVTIVLSCCK